QPSDRRHAGAEVVKAKEKNAKSEAGRQKKQLLILGGLMVVLGIVLAIQFGGSHPDAEATASTQPPGDPASVAQQLASDPAAAAAAAGMTAPDAPGPPRPRPPAGPRPPRRRAPRPRLRPAPCPTTPC